MRINIRRMWTDIERNIAEHTNPMWVAHNLFEAATMHRAK